MPIVFAGSTSADWDILRGNVGWTTDTDFVHSTVNEATVVTLGGDYGAAALTEEVDNHWLSFVTYVQSFNNCIVHVGKFSTNPNFLTTDYWGLRQGATEIYIELNGTHVASIGGLAFGKHRFDVRYRRAEAGLIEVYMDSAFLLSYEGDTRGTGLPFDGVRVRGGSGLGQDSYVSAIMVSTSDTRLFQIHQMGITGPGDVDEWDGDVDLIDNLGLNRNNFILAEDADLDFLMALNKPSIPVGFHVGAISLNANISKYGPLNGVRGIQDDGIDISAIGTPVTPEVVFEGRRFLTEVNPRTGVRYTPEEYAALQLGFQSY